jgi:hypothetical protein
MKILISVGVASLLVAVAITETRAVQCNMRTPAAPKRCTDTFNLCEDPCGDKDICEDEIVLGVLVTAADVRKNRTNNASEPRDCDDGGPNDFCEDMPPVACFVERTCYEKLEAGSWVCAWGMECAPYEYADKVQSQECESDG